MKVVLMMATSLNGIIATPDNKEDFLSHENWEEFVKAVKQRGCFIWGRKTYENVRTWDAAYLDHLKDATKVIVSSDPELILAAGFIWANSPEEALDILDKKGFKEVVLTGGSKINSSFAKLGLIDEMLINLEGVIVGKGIPLFDPAEFELPLELIESNKITANIIQLRYKVKK